MSPDICVRTPAESPPSGSCETYPRTPADLCRGRQREDPRHHTSHPADAGPGDCLLMHCGCILHEQEREGDEASASEDGGQQGPPRNGTVHVSCSRKSDTSKRDSSAGLPGSLLYPGLGRWTTAICQHLSGPEAGPGPGERGFHAFYGFSVQEFQHAS